MWYKRLIVVWEDVVREVWGSELLLASDWL